MRRAVTRKVRSCFRTVPYCTVLCRCVALTQTKFVILVTTVGVGTRHRSAARVLWFFRRKQLSPRMGCKTQVSWKEPGFCSVHGCHNLQLPQFLIPTPTQSIPETLVQGRCRGSPRHNVASVDVKSTQQASIGAKTPFRLPNFPAGVEKTMTKFWSALKSTAWARKFPPDQHPLFQSQSVV